MAVAAPVAEPVAVPVAAAVAVAVVDVAVAAIQAAICNTIVPQRSCPSDRYRAAAKPSAPHMLVCFGQMGAAYASGNVQKKEQMCLGIVQRPFETFEDFFPVQPDE